MATIDDILGRTPSPVVPPPVDSSLEGVGAARGGQNGLGGQTLGRNGMGGAAATPTVNAAAGNRAAGGAATWPSGGTASGSGVSASGGSASGASAAAGSGNAARPSAVASGGASGGSAGAGGGSVAAGAGGSMADASRRVLADGRRVVPSAAEAVNALDVKARGFMPTRHTGTEGPMSVEEALDPKNKNMTLGEIWRRIGPSEAEQEKARKKEKREKLFAAISDGISALSNLFFTTRYAPNMYDAKNSAQKKANDKWKQYWKDLDDDRKDKFDLIWKVKSYDDNKGYQDWKRARDEKRDAADAELEKAKAQRDKENDDLDRRLKLGKISEQEHKAKKAEVEARYAEQQQKAEIARKNRSGRGGGSRGGSGSRGGGYGYGGSGGGSDMDDAYAYWMSLTDEEKNQYRDWNKRGRRVKTGQKGRVATYGTQYMDDDDDFIKQVWEQRKAYLHNNGREDEIPSGGYNIDFRQRHSNDLTRGGRGRGGVKKSAI